MIFAVVGGRGGTGKTTVSAGLAAIWDNVVAVDLDVEGPSLHHFLKPAIASTEKAYLTVPEVDEARCVKCGACRDICQFGAISLEKGALTLLSDKCHGCNACMSICPEKSLIPGQRELGEIMVGNAGAANFVMGKLETGESLSALLTAQVKDRMGFIDGGDVILDAPSGAGAKGVSAAMDASVILLVAEPSLSGLHDIEQGYNAFSSLGKPMGVVINKSGVDDGPIRDFCAENGLAIWAEIPHDRAIAETYARGKVLVDAMPHLTGTFMELKQSMTEAAGEVDDLDILAGLGGMGGIGGMFRA